MANKLLKGVSEAHLVLMRQLYEQGRTAERIAAAVGLQHQQVGKIIQYMEEQRGWLRLNNIHR